MAYNTDIIRPGANLRSGTPLSTGNPFWDMMLSFSKASQSALSTYAPHSGQDARPNRGTVQQPSSSVEVIPVGEETLNVGTRLVSGETTRVRRVVVETPVEKGVSLREERVIVERRKPTGAAATATQPILTDTVIEMSDSFEVADVWKSVRVIEEIVLRREVTNRFETVRDTVRRDEVIVEQATLPATRPQVETTQQDYKASASVQARKPEAVHLAANLEMAAERFETNPDQQLKALTTLHETFDSPVSALVNAATPNIVKAAQPHAPKVPVELPTVTVDLQKASAPSTDAERNDKGGNNRKG